jgi:hypothetical protein
MFRIRRCLEMARSVDRSVGLGKHSKFDVLSTDIDRFSPLLSRQCAWRDVPKSRRMIRPSEMQFAWQFSPIAG